MSLYAERNPMKLDEAGNYYFKHVDAMTGEGLHSKSDIAAELGYRDKKYDDLMEEIRMLRCLEDSYDTQEKVIAEIFLKLNQLCGTPNPAD